MVEGITRDCGEPVSFQIQVRTGDEICKRNLCKSSASISFKFEVMDFWTQTGNSTGLQDSMAYQSHFDCKFELTRCTRLGR